MIDNRIFKYSILLVLIGASMASANDDGLDKLSNLSLSDLKNVVTSVSKRPEDAFTAPAAIYVITQEDIKNSGLRTIPEILRMAPGLQVTQGDAGYWSITSRGFNADGFGNKLLVLMDGRSVYTPVYSGVYWDVQDTFIDDIARIEIIRGPGATLWGANAVNGVINIITKSAKDTQNNVVNVGMGKESKDFIEARHGGMAKDNLFYRVYGKRLDYDSSKTTNGANGGNEGNNNRTGFRADWGNAEANEFTVQGDAYYNDENINLYVPGGSFLRLDKYISSGENLITRWNHKHDNSAKSSLQVYFDNAVSGYDAVHQDNYTFDIDYQYSINIGNKHNLITGLGYRYIIDDIKGSELLSYTSRTRGRSLYSTFVQDTYKIIPEKLHITIGSKFEHNAFTGFEFEPSSRLAWYPNQKNTVWAAISRAVRTPNRAEDDVSLVVSPGPGYARWFGNRDFKSEEVIAYELGHRIKLTNNLSFDSTAFINQFSKLRTNEVSFANLPADTSVGLPFDNKAKAISKGFELASNLSVTDNWKLKGSYTFLTMHIEPTDGSTDTTVAGQSGMSPKHQFGIQSQLYLPHSVELTNSLYYVDELPNLGISSYYRFDSRIMWTPKPGLELSLVGQNLLDDRHQEFSAPINGTTNEIERNVYGKVTVRF